MAYVNFWHKLVVKLPRMVVHPACPRVGRADTTLTPVESKMRPYEASQWMNDDTNDHIDPDRPIDFYYSDEIAENTALWLVNRFPTVNPTYAT